jgi:hypothetical protein
MRANPRPKARAGSLWFWPLAMALVACGETTIDIQNRPREVDLESGLITYLRFDETETGMVAVDSSGHGHDGTPSTSAPLPDLSVPPVGFTNARSLTFNGTDQLIDLGNPPDLDISGQLTLAAWVRVVEANGYRNVIAHGFRWDPPQELSLRVHEGRYEFTAWNSVDHQAVAAMIPGDVDAWHHLAAVYDGQSYRLYRDGLLLDEQAESFMPIQVDAPWAIGGRSAMDPADGRHYSGSIDEVRIYERALSEDEVHALARL